MVCIDWDWRTKIRVTNWDARDQCIKKHAVCWKKRFKNKAQDGHGSMVKRTDL